MNLMEVAVVSAFAGGAVVLDEIYEDGFYDIFISIRAHCVVSVISYQCRQAC